MRSEPSRSSDLLSAARLAAPAMGAALPQIIDSAALFSAGREVQIRHNGGVYTLRQTRQGKLILTK